MWIHAFVSRKTNEREKRKTRSATVHPEKRVTNTEEM